MMQRRKDKELLKSETRLDFPLSGVRNNDGVAQRLRGQRNTAGI